MTDWSLAVNDHDAHKPWLRFASYVFTLVYDVIFIIIIIIICYSLLLFVIIIIIISVLLLF